MKTRAEEIKEDIAKADRDIAFAKESVAYHSKGLKNWQDELAKAEEHKAELQRWLAREVAPLRKVQPEGVKIGAYNV